MSTPEDSESATDDLESSSNPETGEVQQHSVAATAEVSNHPSSEGADENEISRASLPVTNDSDSSSVALLEIPHKDKGKNVVRELELDDNVGRSSVERNQLNTIVYEDRPNRFYGAPSTWYSWTREDREIADSLSKERAKDLSAHLFNAFSLKSRARHHRVNAVAGRTDSTADGADGFKPPKVWTAWPMPPDEVPREHRWLLWDPSDAMTFQGHHDLRPSAELEEMIIATTLRFAKERFDSRESTSGSSTSESVADETQSSAVKSSDPSLNIKPTELRQSLSPTAGSNESYGFGFNEMYTSQPYETNDPITDESGGHGEGSEGADDNMSLTFTADDEEARRVLRPVARHVLSKIDDLLTGLYTIRASYASKKIRRYSTELSQENTGATPSAYSSSPTRKRKSTHSSKANAGTAPLDSVSTSQSRRTTNMRSSHRTPADPQIARLALRDWSEVLGTASITDWDPGVVARASERCAALFGEDMQFRTFFEGDRAGRNPAAAYYVEHTASGKDPARNSGEPLQPAGWITEAESDFDAPTDLESENDPQKSLRCPHHDCERHDRPFRNWREFQKHTKDVHSTRGKKGKAKSAEAPPLSETDFAETGTEGYTTRGSEHEYFCPKQGCPRARRPFSRRPNLYNHIKKVHPDVDIAAFKRLQSRLTGDKRGKWKDERRRRSRKRSSTPFAADTSEMEVGD